MGVANKPKALKKPARRKRAKKAPALQDLLAAAAWAEVDAHLGEALAEFEAWQSGQADAALFAGQALRRAARKRGLAVLGEINAIEPYDAKRHLLIKAVARAPAQVRIVRPGVARGGEMLVKARATGVKRKP